MNFYKNTRNQKIYNCSNFISYITRYIYFIKTPNNIEGLTNSWKNNYINSSQVEKRLINQLRENNF